MCFRSLKWGCLLDFINHELITIRAGPGPLLILVVLRNIWVLRPPPSLGRNMLLLINRAVLFEKLKLVFQAAWKSGHLVFLASYPADPDGFGNTFTLLYNSYFSFGNNLLFRNTNKYLLKSVSRWIFCLLIILSYMQ